MIYNESFVEDFEQWKTENRIKSFSEDSLHRHVESIISEMANHLIIPTKIDNGGQFDEYCFLDLGPVESKKNEGAQ